LRLVDIVYLNKFLYKIYYAVKSKLEMLKKTKAVYVFVSNKTRLYHATWVTIIKLGLILLKFISMLASFRPSAGREMGWEGWE